jgi:hypothetical protein
MGGRLTAFEMMISRPPNLVMDSLTVRIQSASTPISWRRINMTSTVDRRAMYYLMPQETSENYWLTPWIIEALKPYSFSILSATAFALSALERKFTIILLPSWANLAHIFSPNPLQTNYQFDIPLSKAIINYKKSLESLIDMAISWGTVGVRSSLEGPEAAG